MSRRSKALRYYRSSKPSNPLKSFIRSLIKLVIILFIFYQIVTLFFLRTYRMDTAAMEPSIPRGDTVVATPLLFGPELPYTSYEFPRMRSPKRGDTVVVGNDVEDIAWYIAAFDAVLRFFTLQQSSITRDNGAMHIPEERVKRVIGVPGDTVKLEGFRVKIKTRGKSVFLDEREILQNEYEIRVPGEFEQMPGDVPLSGSMTEITLEEGEFLLLSDNRLLATSSHNWHSSAVSDVKALVFFRYTAPF
jgi:signal peptidase I